ncbi:hypothetical protein [Streptomyces sp. cg35]|uniref:hypothetical protein n=1 Tax=Streptomyces sp. cg35 TaxID=3421650 RepID=UPI003D17BD4E
MSDNVLRLMVDEAEVSVFATQRLLQRSPHPGGHRYKLILQDRALIERWFRDVESQESPGSDVQWLIFYGLDRVAGEIDSGSAGKVDYLLNSVESFHVGNGEIIVSGVCSRVADPASDG